MTTTQLAPPTPDLSVLAGLDPGVAYAALFVVALGMVLFYLGPGLRDRFRKVPPAPSAPVETPVAAPALPQAIDAADKLSAEFIAYLKTQIEARDRRIDELEKTVARLDQEVDRLRWQTGGGR